MAEELPLWRRQEIWADVRRRAVLAIVATPGMSEAERLRVMASIDAHCPIPDR